MTLIIVSKLLIRVFVFRLLLPPKDQFYVLQPQAAVVWDWAGAQGRKRRGIVHKGLDIIIPFIALLLQVVDHGLHV